MPTETVVIKYKDVELEVKGEFTPYDEGVWRDADGSGLPPSSSELDIQEIDFEGVDVFKIYESMDEIHSIEEAAIKEIENE